MTERKRGRPSKKSVLAEKIDRLLNPQNWNDGKGVDAWRTVEEVSTPPISLQELADLKPFVHENLTSGSQVSFRVCEDLARSAQRIKERAGPTYDLMSDLSRDAYTLGMIALAIRYQDDLDVDLIIAKGKEKAHRKEEVRRKVQAFSEIVIAEEDPIQRKVMYSQFVSAIRRKTPKIQELYFSAIQNVPLFAEMQALLDAAAVYGEIDDG